MFRRYSCLWWERHDDSYLHSSRNCLPLSFREKKTYMKWVQTMEPKAHPLSSHDPSPPVCFQILKDAQVPQTVQGVYNQASKTWTHGKRRNIQTRTPGFSVNVFLVEINIWIFYHMRRLLPTLSENWLKKTCWSGKHWSLLFSPVSRRSAVTFNTWNANNTGACPQLIWFSDFTLKVNWPHELP